MKENNINLFDKHNNVNVALTSSIGEIRHKYIGSGGYFSRSVNTTTSPDLLPLILLSLEEKGRFRLRKFQETTPKVRNVLKFGQKRYIMDIPSCLTLSSKNSVFFLFLTYCVYSNNTLVIGEGLQNKHSVTFLLETFSILSVDVCINFTKSSIKLQNLTNSYVFSVISGCFL